MNQDRSATHLPIPSDHAAREWNPRSRRSRFVGAIAAVATSSLLLGSVLAIFDSADSAQSTAIASSNAPTGLAA